MSFARLFFNGSINLRSGSSESFVITYDAIADAVNGLIDAFQKKLLVDTLANEKYFNIKTMNSIKLI